MNVLQDDPLEAFMAEINQTNQSEAAAVPMEKKAHLELDEDADHVADFLEVCFTWTPLSCWPAVWCSCCCQHTMSAIQAPLPGSD